MPKDKTHCLHNLALIFCMPSAALLPSAKMMAMADHVDHSSGDEADVEDEQIDENGKMFTTLCNCVTYRLCRCFVHSFGNIFTILTIVFSTT